MTTYSNIELEQFRQLAAAVKRGENVDDGLALRFAMLGWLKQISAQPMCWEVTSDGDAHLK
jgi:hypothetical protein